MKRPLKPEETRLWRAVASTVIPYAGRVLPPDPPPPPRPVAHPKPQAQAEPHRPALPPRKVHAAALHPIEPNRARRIVIGREAIGARLDLHGLDQDRAREALEGFIVQAQLQGCRAVLVITGQGRSGGGVLRRRRCREASAPPAIPARAGAARRPRSGPGR